MNTTKGNEWVGILVAVIIGAGVALAGSQESTAFLGMPVFALCVALAFVIQWLVFIPAYVLQSEKFFDLTGSLSYITVTIVAVILSPRRDARTFLLLGLVVIWAVRLGTFLFLRILKSGKDSRFESIKPSFSKFLMTWTLQGLWISLTLSAALAAITSSTQKPLGFFALLGFLVWVVGFTIEAVADAQKRRFRAASENSGQFIQSGLWAWSRHPNYFGEIVIWVGVAIIALPVLQGWQWVSMISPVFVILLLTKISGIPMLEKKADKRWGGEPDYEAYKASTPVLIPRPPKQG